MNHWCCCCFQQCHVGRFEYWSGRVFSVPCPVLPSLWTGKETRKEQKRRCIFLGNLQSLSMKAVGCYNASFVCCVTLEMLCVVRFPRVCLLTPHLMTQGWRLVTLVLFLPPLFSVSSLLLGSIEPFHQLSLFIRNTFPFFFCPTIEDTTVSYSNALKDVLKYRNSHWYVYLL